MDRIGGTRSEKPVNALPLLDAAQLRRQTQGNPILQVEVLSLFVAEAERLMRQVEDASDLQVRGDRLRALFGLARNTGATLIAHEARTLETQVATETPDMTPLRNAVADTLALIRRTTS
jgi:hypothetical protein